MVKEKLELNKKLAVDFLNWEDAEVTTNEWDGSMGIIGYHTTFDDGKGKRIRDTFHSDVFTDSLDACFEHLVPKLEYAQISWQNPPKVYCVAFASIVGGLEFSAEAETPALALCKAIEKLIDEKS